MTYSEIYNIENPKEKMFACMDRIREIELISGLFGVTETEDLELRNLEVLKMNAYSDWKD